MPTPFMQKQLLFSFCLAAVVGGLTTLVCGVSKGLVQAQEEVRAALPVVIFFQANIPDDESRSVSQTLKAQDAAIETMTYISKEQAYAQAAKDPLLSRSLMLLHDNPLSAVTELHYSRQAWLERTDPMQTLHQLPGIQEIRWSAAQKNALLSFEPWKKAIAKTLWAVSGLLLVWTLGGIRAFASTLSEWRKGLCLVVSATLGAAGSWIFWSLAFPGQPYPLLPVLFGSLIGIGSFSERCP